MKFVAGFNYVFNLFKTASNNIDNCNGFDLKYVFYLSTYLRILTGFTHDDLGFVTDNPSSAEAIKASHETLRIAARKAQRCFGSGFLNVGYVARCIEDEMPYVRNQFYLTKPKWYPVFEPDVATLSGIGDAAIKINQAIPGFFGKDNLSDLTGFNASKEPSVIEAEDEE